MESPYRPQIGMASQNRIHKFFEISNHFKWFETVKILKILNPQWMTSASVMVKSDEN